MTIEYYFAETQLEYYEAGNVDEMAAAICGLYADFEKRAELARQGTEFARHFNWEIFRHDLYRVVAGDSVAGREELQEEVAQGSAVE